MQRYIYDPDKLPRPYVEGHPEWTQLYYKAWELAFQNVEYIELPGWKPQMTCMPGVNTIWQWDSCLMVFITNYANGTISALNNLDNLYRLRRESDGYMSMAYRISTEVPAWPGRINPPLMAWAEWEAYRVSGNVRRLQEVLPALEGNYRFIEENRRRNSGLYWFEDPGSSGMDNAPRGPYACDALDGSGICHVDLACQQSLSAMCMAKMLRVLGDQEKASFYEKENQRINDLINRFHWSEKIGFYFDFFGRSSADTKVKLINNKTAAAFWTILCGAAQGERLEKLLSHMLNPEEFNTPIPFATLSADDPNYDPDGGYWLGGVWAPTNYAAIRGMQEKGKGALAREMAIRYLQAVTQVANNADYDNTIWECYSPTQYRPATAEAGELVRKDFVGWSGLAPIAMLIEQIMGLSFDAAENTVTMELFPGQLCGLENLCFRGGKLSISCIKVGPAEGENVVEITTQRPFTLILRNSESGKEACFDVLPGLCQYVF